MPDLPERLIKLAKEYRPTMDCEVLHSWATDVVAALDEAQRAKFAVIEYAVHNPGEEPMIARKPIDELPDWVQKLLGPRYVDNDDGTTRVEYPVRGVLTIVKKG